MTAPSLLAGARAVVTGGGDIGSAIVRGLARHGAVVEVWDRSTTALDGAARDAPERIRTRRVDVTSADEVEAAAGRAWSDGNGVDVLVNSAAIATFAPVAELDPKQWQETIDVNLTGVFLVCRAFAPRMVDAGRGSIVNISSIGGLRGEPEFAHYCASKFGVIGLTQSLAREVGPSGVRVNAVCPGAVESQMNTETMARDARRLACDVADIERRIVERTALRRLVQPADIADAVVFLASDLARTITGESLAVTGGIF